MSSQENIAGLRRVYEIFSTGNLDALDDLISADMVDRNPDPDQGPGLQGLKDAFTRLRSTVPDLRFTVEDTVAEGDKVAARVTISGTDQGGLIPGAPPTGRSFSVSLIDIIRFADGKAVERWGVFDGLTMMQQLGTAPASAQTGG